MRNPVPRIAAIHDMSGFGRTSLTVAIPILSCMGIQVCPMPTAVLSTHTVEFTDYTLCDLTPELGGILDHWERLGLHFDGVYSGFMASPAQMDSAARCIRNCLAPGGLAVVDPVLGDNGILDPTMTPEMVEKMRWLISCADIITPNITEACLLTGRSFNPCPTLHETKEMLRELCGFGVRFAVITGFSEKGQLGAVGCFDGAFTECLTPKKDVACSGTGDVFASALLGAVLRGADYPQALEIATKFTYAAVEYTAAASDRRFYGIHFQPVLGEYIRMLERVEKGRSDG